VLFQQEKQTVMNKNNSKNISRTDWEYLENMSDEDIDYSDIPPLTDDFFNHAVLRIPAEQSQNWLQLDPKIINWFKSQNIDYKTAINSVLSSYIETH
jgi:uncharacterized protein (DUF4415 family)